MDKNNIDGVIVIDKPAGWTSHDVVSKVKNIVRAKRAGHTGTLDPLATGVLPVCINSATKLSNLLMQGEKEYEVEILFGKKTNTYDLEGDIVSEEVVPGDLFEMVRGLITGFTGDILQVPPYFSAVKHNGRPLYYWARQGKLIDLPPRRVTIHSFFITAEDQSTIKATINCSKGTYIRSICHDLGEMVGCGAVMSKLRRIRTGPFSIESSITIDELQNANNNNGLECVIVGIDKIKKIINVEENSLQT